jgi:hypothetical protein
MQYMILMGYKAEGVAPITTWDPADVERHIAFQHSFGNELRASGELVGANGLAWPEDAKIVVSDGTGEPAVTDGPFPESKEFLAGYWIVDVADEARAIEIAAKASAAPGPEGRPLGHPIEVRAVLSAPADPSA